MKFDPLWPDARREFIMKDGYSFHTDENSLKQTYQDMQNNMLAVWFAFSAC